jgi:hypothetical protein
MIGHSKIPRMSGEGTRLSARSQSTTNDDKQTQNERKTSLALPSERSITGRKVAWGLTSATVPFSYA